MYCAIGATTHIGIFASNTLQAFNQTPRLVLRPHAAQFIAPYGGIKQHGWLSFVPGN